MSTSNIKLLNTIEWSKRFNFRKPVANGNYLEPALSNANIILQTILSAPFVWRWNRIVTGFVTIPGQQDYYLVTWSASAHLAVNTFVVDSNGNSQQVTTAGTTGTILPTWNSSPGSMTTDGSVVWTNLGSINTPVSTSFDFGFIETSSVQDPTNTFKGTTTPKWYPLESKICLELDSSNTTRPRTIAAQADDGNGGITFRLMPVPDIAYPVAITIQEKPPVFDSLFQTWAPIPDEYSRIYNWGFLALFYLYSDDPRYGAANQKFISQLLSVNEGLTETERNVFLGNWNSITGAPVENMNRTQQGEQMRGL